MKATSDRSDRNRAHEAGWLFSPAWARWKEAGPTHLQRLSGMSSRLLLAAMNSSRLASFPMPEGMPSKSNLLEFRYSFFSFVTLQMADWGRSRDHLPQQILIQARKKVLSRAHSCVCAFVCNFSHFPSHYT